METESIQIYTQTELEFLKALLTYRTTIRTLQVTIREADFPRTFIHLAEVDTIDRQLACIENRGHYVHALPQENLFALDPPLSIFPNPIEQLTLGLIVNLVLYRQIDFQLDADTRQDFHELAYVDGEIRPSLRQQLLAWISQYLEQSHQPDAVRTYTVSYWDDCLRSEGQRISPCIDSAVKRPSFCCCNRPKCLHSAHVVQSPFCHSTEILIGVNSVLESTDQLLACLSESKHGQQADGRSTPYL